MCTVGPILLWSPKIINTPGRRWVFLPKQALSACCIQDVGRHERTTKNIEMRSSVSLVHTYSKYYLSRASSRHESTTLSAILTGQAQGHLEDVVHLKTVVKHLLRHLVADQMSRLHFTRISSRVPAGGG